MKHACVDLTRVFPTCGIGDGRFYYGTTTLKIASSKMTKHKKICSENQSTYIVSPRSINIVFKRIDFIIQKEAVT